MADTDQNGKGDTEQAQPWLEVVLTRATPGGDLVLQSTSPNTDELLNALQQALRHIEAQWRYDKAQQVAQAKLRELPVVLPAHEWKPRRQ